MKIQPVTALRIAALAAALALAGTAAQASPVAYAERSFSVAGGYTFGGSFYGLGSVEVPLDLSLPVDLSVAIDAGFKAGGPLVGGTVKALLLPSLLGDPPLALALAARVSAGDIRPIEAGPRFALGPIVSLDFSPVVVSASAAVGFGGGPFGADLGTSVSYYLDPVVFDLAFNYSTAGSGQVSLALRYLF